MVVVRVPATTANLGPGFDCLGAALSLYASSSFELLPGGLEITGTEPRFSGESNLVYQAYLAALKLHGIPPAGLRLHMASDIPASRGLGSSAACILGGIMGADALHGLQMSKEAVFRLAVSLEGHPDNIAPALFGGVQVSLMEGGKPLALPVALHPAWRFLALVPDFALSTTAARAALPDLVSLKDAVYNLSHAAFLVKALEQSDAALLRSACQDSLHQDARFALIPGGRELKARAENQGAAACFLSGAGSSLMCIYQDPGLPGRLKPELNTAFPHVEALPLCLCSQGATRIQDKGLN